MNLILTTLLFKTLGKCENVTCFLSFHVLVFEFFFLIFFFLSLSYIRQTRRDTESVPPSVRGAGEGAKQQNPMCGEGGSGGPGEGSLRVHLGFSAAGLRCIIFLCFFFGFLRGRAVLRTFPGVGGKDSVVQKGTNGGVGPDLFHGTTTPNHTGSSSPMGEKKCMLATCASTLEAIFLRSAIFLFFFFWWCPLPPSVAIIRVGDEQIFSYWYRCLRVPKPLPLPCASQRSPLQGTCRPL